MTRDRRLYAAMALNGVIVAVQVAAGLTAHSLALLADAGHNLTDVAAIALALVAVRLTRRPPTTERSFGYHRSTVLAAQANAAAILAVTAVVAYEAARRLDHPHAVRGGVVVAVALTSLLVNAAAARLLNERGRDLNMRAAWLHMVGDALASGGVLVAGAVILATGRFDRLDPAISLAIAVLIAWEAILLVRQTTDVLLESTPADLDVRALARAMATVPGIEDVHDLHAWTLSSDYLALSAHLVLDGHPTLEEAQAVGNRVKALIGREFGIAHATLELECEACADGADPCAPVDASR